MEDAYLPVGVSAAPVRGRLCRRASERPELGVRPAGCSVAKTPTLPGRLRRLIIDKRKTLPRKLVPNRAAPAPACGGKAGCPVPSPRLRGPGSRAAAALGLGDPAGPGGMQPSGFYILKFGFPRWLQSSPPGIGLSGGGAFPTLGKQGLGAPGRRGVPVTSGCCSESRAQSRSAGDGGGGRRPTPTRREPQRRRGAHSSLRVGRGGGARRRWKAPGL